MLQVYEYLAVYTVHTMSNRQLCVCVQGVQPSLARATLPPGPFRSHTPWASSPAYQQVTATLLTQLRHAAVAYCKISAVNQHERLNSWLCFFLLLLGGVTT
jgi:hypothetical protein